MKKKSLLFLPLLLLNLSACMNNEGKSSDGVPPQKVDSSFANNVHKKDSSIVEQKTPYSASTDSNNVVKGSFYGVDYDGDTVIYEKDGKVLKEGYITGRFVEMQKGDYLHIVLQDSLGWLHTFWVWFDDDKLMDKYWTGKQPAPNEKIRVHWKRERENLEEAGGVRVIYKMVGIESVK